MLNSVQCRAVNPLEMSYTNVVLCSLFLFFKKEKKKEEDKECSLPHGYTVCRRTTKVDVV